MRLDQRCARIEFLLCDVDGVLTDGAVLLDNQGIEAKAFHIRDGMGIRLWQRAGYRCGLITGRTSQIVKLRAAELGMDILRQGVDEKLPAVQEILGELELSPEQTCFIGDDLPDLSVVQTVGLGVAVADAAEELRQAAHYTTSVGGGRGALRECVELILKNQGRWDDFVRRFQAS